MTQPSSARPRKAGVFFPLPQTSSWRQWIYVWVLQGLAAGIIDGIINFGIAMRMYHFEAYTSFWAFPLPFAGDLGVTCLVQGLATFIIVPNLILPDLHAGRIAPLPEPWPRTAHLPDPSRAITDDAPRHSRFAYYMQMLLRFGAEGNENMGFFSLGRSGRKPGARGVFERLAWSIAQGLVWGAVLFFLFWPLAIAILAPIYTHRSMSSADGHLWTAEIIKFVFTFVLGMFQNALVALQVLGARFNYVDDAFLPPAPLANADAVLERGDSERTPLIRD